MRVDTFLVEQFMNAYEHKVEYNLAETCVEPFTLGEFLALVDQENFFEQLREAKLNYGFIQGSPNLLEELSNLYEDVKQENIIATNGAISANFLVFYSLIEPGDTIVSIFPAYQQLYSVAKSFGAKVKRLHLRESNEWLPDVDELSGLVDDKTKLVVMNNPHNPTGSLIDTRLLQKICTVIEDSNALLLCDESYRGLYVEPNDSVPSAIDISDRAIVTGSFSKPFSLTGLRLGWVAAEGDIIKECLLHRDYTTISTNMISNSLAILALKHRDRIFKRNLRILRANHNFLSKWIENEPLMDWIPPKAGSSTLLRYGIKVPSKELSLRLIREKGVFLVPSYCFEIEGYLRIGYGCSTRTLREGMSRFKDFLNSYRKS